MSDKSSKPQLDFKPTILEENESYDAKDNIDTIDFNKLADACRDFSNRSSEIILCAKGDAGVSVIDNVFSNKNKILSLSIQSQNDDNVEEKLISISTKYEEKSLYICLSLWLRFCGFTSHILWSFSVCLILLYGIFVACYSSIHKLSVWYNILFAIWWGLFSCFIWLAFYWKGHERLRFNLQSYTYTHPQACDHGIYWAYVLILVILSLVAKFFPLFEFWCGSTGTLLHWIANPMAFCVNWGAMYTVDVFVMYLCMIGKSKYYNLRQRIENGTIGVNEFEQNFLEIQEFIKKMNEDWFLFIGLPGMITIKCLYNVAYLISAALVWSSIYYDSVWVYCSGNSWLALWIIVIRSVLRIILAIFGIVQLNGEPKQLYAAICINDELFENSGRIRDILTNNPPAVTILWTKITKNSIYLTVFAGFCTVIFLMS